MLTSSLFRSLRRLIDNSLYRRVFARTALSSVWAVYLVANNGCDRPAEATRATPTASTTAATIVVEPDPAQAGPIRLEPPTIDFGPIQRGIAAEATVRLINTSDQPLQIKQVKTSCGCTTAKVSKEPFGPGESIEVTVRLKTRSKPGSRANKTVRFFLDGDYDPVPLSVTAEIVEFVTIKPETLKRPVTEDQKIVIRSSDRQRFRILEVRPPLVNTLLARQANSSHELVLSADLWLEHGRPDTLTLVIDHPDTDQVELRITRPRKSKSRTSKPRSARVTESTARAANAKRKVSRPVLQTHPRRMNFGHLTPTEDVEREFHLRDVTVVEGVEPIVRSDSSLVNVELLNWQKSPDGLRLNLRMTAVPGQRGRVEALITVDYGSGRGFIEIHGRVRPDKDVAMTVGSTTSNETDRSQKKGE